MGDVIAGRGPVRALGAMSGTSLDGVDAAVLLTDGHTITDFGPTQYRRYTDAIQRTLSAALGLWSGAEVEAATKVVEQVHIEVLSDFDDADIVGFHGQTIAHAPRTRGTLQVGNGRTLARALNTPVVWDFRTTDIQNGGEGAPLAPFFHHACARWADITEPVAFLNLGGVGNLTWVDPMMDAPETPGALLAFDTGPANAPINDLVKARLELPFDNGGKLIAQGRVDADIVAQFRTHPYFAQHPPKSLDRNDFADAVALVDTLADADAAATLAAMCVEGVAAALPHCPRPPTHVLVTGGGRLNPAIMQMLRDRLHCPVTPVEDIGLNGDMLEAQAFAYLAVRVARGLPTSQPGSTGVAHPVSGGRISVP